MAKTKNGITKMEAVKSALAELGRDAQPVEIKDFVQKRHGVAITTEVVSTYKAVLKRQNFAGVTPMVAKPSSQAVPSVATRAAAATKHGGNEVSLADIKTVKALVGRLDTASLKTLVDLMSS